MGQRSPYVVVTKFHRVEMCKIYFFYVPGCIFQFFVMATYEKAHNLLETLLSFHVNVLMLMAISTATFDFSWTPFPFLGFFHCS